MESLLPLIIQLVSGAVGGNLIGSMLRRISLGDFGNSIAGIVGGGIGGSLLGMLGMGLGGGGMDAAGILATVAGSAVGGGLLMLLIGGVGLIIRGSSSIIPRESNKPLPSSENDNWIKKFLIKSALATFVGIISKIILISLGMPEALAIGGGTIAFVSITIFG